MAEGGTIGAPAAVANAVADALGGLGIDSGAIDFYPLTAPRLFALVGDGRGASGGLGGPG